MEDRGWDAIPPDLRVSFAKYMGEEVWTHLPDLLSLREAALMIIRDAIARTGEFSPEAADEPEHAAAPLKAHLAE